MNKMFLSCWYNCRHSAQVLCNCNKLTVYGPFPVPFLLILNISPKIQSAPPPQLGWGLMFLPASYRLRSDPSLTRNYNKFSRRGPLTRKNYKTTAKESVYTSATNDNYPSCVFLLSDRSCTIAWVSHLVLPVPLVSTALAPSYQVVHEY